MSIEQQPEAWIIVNRDTGYRIQVSLFPDLYNKDMFEVIPLYTAPPKPDQKPLSNADQMELHNRLRQQGNLTQDGCWDAIEVFNEFLCEKAHGIGEG
jgi:hypothetical protein